MDWNSLKIFLAIANKGSLGSAARELKVNHSTVFRRLGQFEEDIGGRLFERINNRYHLTPMGQELFDLAKTIEHSFDDIERTIVGNDIQAKGTVKITAPYNIACYYLSRYITAFNQQYTDIHIELLASNIEFNMTNRQADIAVRATSSPPEYLIGRQVCTIGWGVYGSPTYQEQHGYPTSTKDLAMHNIIGATGGISHLSAFTWLNKHYPEQITTRCDELMVMANLAALGHGLAILPNDQAHDGLEKVLAFTPKKSSNLWLLTHPDLRKVKRIKCVMQYLTHAFSSEQLA